MKRFSAILIIIILLTFSSCAAIGMDNLPSGEMIKTSKSPNEQYRIEAYLCSGNATTDYSIRCAVVEINTKESRNFFWQYHQENATIKWIDDYNVEINGIKLNILTDSYDWRN